MSHPTALATQAEAVARELAVFSELLASDIAVGPIAESIALVESIGRAVDAARVRVLAPLVTSPVLVERLGHASAIAAVASIARISERSARARLKVAAAVTGEFSVTGAPLPPALPLVGDALDSGAVGLDAAVLITGELTSIRSHAPADVLQVTETAMVHLASGLDGSGRPMASTVSVDFLAGELRQLAAAADPDGARPREERAARRRDFRLGRPDEDGLVPAFARLLPEIAALAAGVFEAHRRSPKFVDANLDSGEFGVGGPDLNLADHLALNDDQRTADQRTPGQRRHDAFAEIIMAAAAADGAPRLDGQAVTVLVTVTAADLANESGRDGDPIGTMAGTPHPISRRTVERFIDAGGYRVVTTDENGAVTAISTPQRCFTPLQRFGMAARDGLGCITPGCTSPHFMLQAHHVDPYRDGGPTSLGNGVLLCYWHHLIVDTGPWQYQMINATPYVRGPGIPDWTPTRKQLRQAA